MYHCNFNYHYVILLPKRTTPHISSFKYGGYLDEDFLIYSHAFWPELLKRVIIMRGKCNLEWIDLLFERTVGANHETVNKAVLSKK